MDEVPAIIHRLSLRLWVPEYRAKEDEELARQTQNPTDEKPVDPLASPPQDPVDVSGNTLDASQIASLSLDSNSEYQALFSQKNLLRLAALTDSHRTLSLFTPSIRDVVFRAWAGPSERGEPPGRASAPMISRAQSWAGTTSHTYTFSESSEGPSSARPTLSSFGSTATGFGLGASKSGRSQGARRKKHRVVNLRKKATEGEDMLSASGDGSTISETTSSAAQSEFGAPPSSQEREGELITPPQSPLRKPAQKDRVSSDENTPLSTNRQAPKTAYTDRPNDLTPKPSRHIVFNEGSDSQPRRPTLPTSQSYQPYVHPPEKVQPQSSAQVLHPTPAPLQYFDSPVGGILEQAWMMKMAGEIAKKLHEEKSADSGFWDRAANLQEDTPPPAYA